MNSKHLPLLFFLCACLVLQAQPGTLDATFNPTDLGFGNGDGANSNVSAIAIQPDGKTIIGGYFQSYNGTLRNNIARLNADGSLDTGFNPGTGFDNYFASNVNTIAIQPDGKILVGGAFESYNGTSRINIARLNADGSLDTSFDSGTVANDEVHSLAIQPDGKVIIGGSFTNFNGTSRNHIARLNADGTLDTSFNPGTGTNFDVFSVALQPDGKIIIGGYFQNYNGTPRDNIARLNADGSLDQSFNPGTDETIYAIAAQPDGKIIIGGFFTSCNGTAYNRIARLNNDGSLDTGFSIGTGATGTGSAVENIVLQADGTILIGGSFESYNGTQRHRIALLNTDGSLNTGFDPGYGANSSVVAIGIQSDGQIMIGGGFTNYDGTPQNYITRLNADGSLDTGFNSGTGANGAVYAVAYQPDGKIIIGGYFTSYNGLARNKAARLNSDGSLDTEFNTATVEDFDGVHTIAVQPDGKIIMMGSSTFSSNYIIERLNTDGSADGGFFPYSASNSSLLDMAVQPDGKILFVGGSFSSGNGFIGRLNEDGSPDAGFNPGSGASDWIQTLLLQPDGKILIGGFFSSYNGTPSNRIARLNADGSIDTGFNPGTGANDLIGAMVLQPNGKIIIGGRFTSYNGTSRKNIARLNADGSLDMSFNSGSGANAEILDIAVQPDGKIILAGEFTQYNGTARNRIARLNADGSLNAGFNYTSGADGWVGAVSLQSDGKILIGGAFTSYNGTGRNRIARINGGGASGCSVEINTITPTHETCPGANNGGISINADCLGCTGALEYSINNGSNFQPGSNFMGLPDGVYQIVVRDAGNTSCSATSSVTVNAGVDNMPPGITCPPTQTLELSSACTAELPNYTSLAMTSDNCGVQSITQSPAAGVTVSGAGNLMVSLTVTDINGLSNSCTFTVSKVTNTACFICPAGDITFFTQAQIDSFPINYPGCTEIAGAVTISGQNITNLDGLSPIVSINGSLNITFNPNLAYLGGFANLTTVGGNLYINNNPTLPHFLGLDNLETIGGTLDINTNAGLLYADGLGGLTEISGGFGIYANPILISIGNLNSLNAIGVDLYVANNPIMTDLGNLTSLNTIGGGLYVNWNPNLHNFNGLNSLGSVNGGVFINNNASLANLSGLNNLETIGGTLDINTNAGLLTLNGLGDLTEISGGFGIYANSMLMSIGNLGNLNAIGMDLFIANNPMMADLGNLTSLNTIGGGLYINTNPDLPNLNGLSSLGNVNGGVFINNNASLADCDIAAVCQKIINPIGGIQIFDNAPCSACFNLTIVEAICNTPAPCGTGCPDEIIWTGNASNSDWNDPCNWSSLTVPEQEDDVYFYGYASVETNISIAVNTIYISNDGDVYLYGTGGGISFAANNIYASNAYTFEVGGFGFGATIENLDIQNMYPGAYVNIEKGTFTGNIQIGSSTLELSGKTYFEAGVSVNGNADGSINFLQGFNNQTVYVNTALQIPCSAILTGQISGSGELQLQNGQYQFGFDIYGSTFNIPVTLSWNPLITPNPELYLESVITNNNVLTFSNSLSLNFEDGVLQNNGALHLNGDASQWNLIGGSGLLSNEGTLHLGVEHVANIEIPITNAGRLTGAGTLEWAGAFLQAGTISPGNSPGTLTINPSISTAPTAVFDMEIIGNQHDLLTSSGAIGLDGTLRIRFDNPDDGAYTIVSGASRSGTFTQVEHAIGAGAYNPGLPAWASLSYLSNGVQVVVNQAVLPIELLSFTAHAEENAVQLHWRTASEQHNKGFHIQRSADGTNWRVISFVPGAGNSTEERHYQLTDRQPLQGHSYYRLLQEDEDGKTTLSDIRHVFREEASGYAVFPNPADRRLTLRVQGSDAPIQARLRNSAGQIVLQQSSATHLLEFDIEALPAGIYWLEWDCRSGACREKVVLGR